MRSYVDLLRWHLAFDILTKLTDKYPWARVAKAQIRRDLFQTK